MDFLFSHKGRIGRLEWWLGSLITIPLLTAAMFLIFSDLNGRRPQSAVEFNSTLNLTTVLAVLAIYALCIWINACLTIKRFHDRDKSGWWYCIMFVPYIGSLWLLIECGFLSGTPGSNRFDVSRNYDDLDFDLEPRQKALDLLPRHDRLMDRPASVSPVASMSGRSFARTAAPAGFGKRSR